MLNFYLVKKEMFQMSCNFSLPDKFLYENIYFQIALKTFGASKIMTVLPTNDILKICIPRTNYIHLL